MSEDSLTMVLPNGETSTNNYGTLHFFKYSNSSWISSGNRSPVNATDKLNRFVELNSKGNIVLATSFTNPSSNGSNWGGVGYVFKYNGSTWNQMGQAIFGGPYDYLAQYSAAINSEGNIIFLPVGNFGNSNMGKVMIYHFKESQQSWVKIKEITGTVTQDSPQQNWSLGINSSGSRVAIANASFDGVKVYDLSY